MIAIIDYGAGNIGSVAKAFITIGAKLKVTSSPKDLDKADKIALPGVGAFYDGMQALKRLKLIPALVRNIQKGKPYLGLCLGMQLLFEESEEGGRHKGLGILEGKVVRFKLPITNYQLPITNLKVPHMGWNRIKRTTHDAKRKTPLCLLLKGIPDRTWMYFGHSYYAVPKDKSVIAATTGYGIEFVSMIWKDNIFATQFHPEKSQQIGMKILENFINL